MNTVQMNRGGTIARLEDGTVQTRGALYSKPWATRVAIVNAIAKSVATDPRVEIELRDGSVLIGSLITVALAKGGTTTDLLVVHEPDRIVPTAVSLATIRSISQLTLREYAQRVHA